MNVILERVIGGRAIWQSDTAKTYQCPICRRPVFSQYEGDETPIIICAGIMGDHVLRWESGQP